MQRTYLALGAALLSVFALSSMPATAQAKKAKPCYSKTLAEEADAKQAKYKISKGKNIDVAINESLTGKPGDPKKGLEWIVNRKLGNCIACHKVEAILKLVKPGDLKSQAKYGFHGEVGPELDGVASRYTEGELRMLIVDPKKVFPDTIMPAFHKDGPFVRIKENCKGKVMLSPSRVEDVVAYLKTLK